MTRDTAVRESATTLVGTEYIVYEVLYMKDMK